MDTIACELEGHKVSEADKEKYEKQMRIRGTPYVVVSYKCTRCGVTGWYSETGPDDGSNTTSSIHDYVDIDHVKSDE